MDKYFIEQINVSDSHYKITYISNNLDFIKCGDILFAYESSKANYDVISEKEGKVFLNPSIEIGYNYEVGTLVLVITDQDLSKEEIDEIFQIKQEKDIFSHENTKTVITKKAQILIDKHNLDINVFQDKEVISEEIVLNHLRESSFVSQNSHNKIIIIGGRGGAKMIIEAVRSIGYFSIKGIIDETIEKGSEVLGVKVLGGEQDLINFHNEGYENIVLSFTSLSDLSLRESKYKLYKSMGFKFPNIIHNRATVEPSVTMGEGNIVLANAMIGSDVTIGDVNFINTGAIISHDTIAYLNNHFAPNSVLAGRIKIGKNNLFGMCSTVFFDTIIGNNNTIYNGVNVFGNIGNGMIIKKN